MASASLAGPRPQSPSPSPSPPFSSSQTALQPKKLRTLQQVSLSTHRRKGSSSSSSSIMTKTQPPHRSPYYTRTRLLHQLGIAPQQPPKQGCSTATTGSSPVEISCLASEYAPSSSSSSHNHHHNHQSMLGGMVPFETKLNDSEEFYAHADAHAAADHGDGDERSSSSAPQHQPQPSLFHDHLHPTSSISTSSPSMSVSMTSSSKSSSSSSSSNKSNRLQFKETVQVLPIPSRYQYSDRIKQCIWSNRYELQEMAQRNLQEFASENYDWRNVVLDEDMYIDASSSGGGPPQLIHPCHLQPNYNNTSAATNNTTAAAAAAVSSTSDDDETKNGHEPEEDQEDDDDDDDAHFAPLQKFESFVTAGQ